MVFLIYVLYSSKQIVANLLFACLIATLPSFLVIELLMIVIIELPVITFQPPLITGITSEMETEIVGWGCSKESLPREMTQVGTMSL